MAILLTSGQSRCFHGMWPQMKSRWSSRNFEDSKLKTSPQRIWKDFDIDIKIWGHLPGFRFSVWCVFCCCSAWNVQAIIKAINAGQRLPAGWTFDLFLFSCSKTLVAKAVVGMMAWYHPGGESISHPSRYNWRLVRWRVLIWHYLTDGEKLSCWQLHLVRGWRVSIILFGWI